MPQPTNRLARRRSEDTADVVQTVVLIAGFVLVSIVLVIWLSQAVLNKGADSASCVEAVQAPAYTGNDHGTEDNCKAVNHSTDHSFTSTSEYTNRY